MKIMSKKNCWYNWLINNISEINKKTVSSVKGKITSFFKTSTNENYSKPRKSKTKKQSEDKIIKAV